MNKEMTVADSIRMKQACTICEFFSDFFIKERVKIIIGVM